MIKVTDTEFNKSRVFPQWNVKAVGDFVKSRQDVPDEPKDFYIKWVKDILIKVEIISSREYYNPDELEIVFK